jgi:hypothetical protein
VKIFINDRYQVIGPHQLSIAHTGYPLIMLEDKTFWTTQNGNDYYRYFDLEPGLLEFGGSTWLISHATRHVDEDGTAIAFLPTVGKYVVRRPLEDSYKVLNPFDAASIEERDIRGVAHLTNGRLDGPDLWGSRVCYTNAGGFWRLSPAGQWESALEKAPFRHALAVKATSSTTGVSAVVFFEIYDTPPAQRWLELFKRTQRYVQRVNPLDTVAIKHQNVMYGFGQQNVDACVARISDLVSRLNTIYQSRLPDSDAGKLRSVQPGTVSQEILNQLHHEFEAFGDRHRAHEFAGDSQAELRHGLFSKLNNSIHATEAALVNATASAEDASLLAHVNFFPDVYESLHERDYRYFTQDLKFGELCMGYHTLGKDFAAVFGNNDLDCIMRKEVRPQRIANTEIITYLGPTRTGVDDSFRKWWTDNKIDSYGYSLEDPANAVGYLPIGRLLDWQTVSETDVRQRISEFDAIEWAIVSSTRFEVWA